MRKRREERQSIDVDDGGDDGGSDGRDGDGKSDSDELRIAAV